MTDGDKCIYVHVTGYLRQWTVNRFGCPVKFPNKSWENEIIARNLIIRPANVVPQKANKSDLAISVPAIWHHPWQTYNHFTQNGCTGLTRAIRNLFVLDMMQSIMPYISQPNLYQTIEDWCHKRGITTEYHGAVIKKFYRVRCTYEAHGLIVRKRYNRQANE